MTILRTRLGAALAVAALAVVGLPGTGAAAAVAPSTANIDPTASGSLTITSLARTGDDAVTPAPVEGVTFTVQQVTSYNGEPVDLTTPEGWQTIDGITVDDVPNAVLAAGTARTTAADGTATFGPLPLGLYYVTETGSPAHVAARTVPFLVTLPHPDTTAGTWTYDVSVSPKSSVASAGKQVDDDGALALGSTVTWTLSGSVPPPPDGGTLEQYVVTDRLDERLSYLGDTVTVTTTPSAALGAGDYAVTYADRLLTVELTPAGLSKLAGIGSVTSELAVTFDTEVLAIGDGTIENQAAFTIGQATFSPQAVTQWGAVEIYKHVEGDTGAPLSGAVFEAYATASDAAARTNALEIWVGDKDVSQFITGEDGLVLLPGFSAGETVYLAEVQAPAGYTASDEVYQVVVTAGSVPQRVSVANSQRTGVDLPVLGAQGMALAGLVGLGLIGGGVGLGVASRRRRSVG
ncbi:SpaH/EbpB family LPXTG-anchored major pilin [Georgenia sp. H159]|uniref:SpaH/EbpB family LPXTG-anchored major pilin n=1 Tax=Georgenia sp. H159 TaxID=3076115 RepID=UPI002D79221C|nr:SpaH/EbpB family LPXTG-anchored major pilin [Georgenia sp. H159]